jgi:organic hydroperoxide reductase OsmC/OhrA
MNKQHNYLTTIIWTGNKGTGTSGYRAYDRSHTLHVDGKEDILCSSDPAFQGDNKKFNPEDFFLASLSSCHMLWYLHLCADAGIVVVDYKDNATGVMIEDPVEGGRFTSVTLNPVVTITKSSMIVKAIALHDEAHKQCFMSNSVNFPVLHNPKFIVIP